jgi:hypothetical protein
VISVYLLDRLFHHIVARNIGIEDLRIVSMLCFILFSLPLMDSIRTRKAMVKVLLPALLDSRLILSSPSHQKEKRANRSQVLVSFQMLGSISSVATRTTFLEEQL